MLHISGHGSPGTLDLENEDGSARTVTAEQFLDQAIPAGRMPPVISLAACYTDAAASQDGVSFAARLCARGAGAVVATETSITDTYATRLLARLYGTLARSHTPTSSPRCPMRGVKSRPSWRPPRASGTTSWPGWANGRP